MNQDDDPSVVLDPICGMRLAPSQVAVTFTYLGQSYAFCCAECRDLFARRPEVHVVRLAHEPDESAGHNCPYRRKANSGGQIIAPSDQ